MTRHLDDRIALVFGAGSIGAGWGNGKASAVAYARNGAKVACVDIQEAAARETADIIKGEGGEAIALVADVTNSAEVKAAVAATLKAFKRVDILHNNVGHAKMGSPIDLAEEDWQRQLDINLSGVFLAGASDDDDLVVAVAADIEKGAL